MIVTQKRLDGIEKAKAAGKYKGRKPQASREDYDAIVKLVELGAGDTTIARLRKVSRAIVIRIRKDPRQYEEALKNWGL